MLPSFAQVEHQGVVLDVTTKHILMTGGISSSNLAAGEADPRAMMQLQRHQVTLNNAEQHYAPSMPDLPNNAIVQATSSRTVQGSTTQITKNRKIDWSINLGAGTVSPHQSPAKYGFDVNAQPDCVNDYVVFGLNVAGVSGGQANLLGINQLYSGTNPTGYCGTTPHVNWAYNGSTAGGSILTSPALSLDGTKIAYIESTANSSILHVLTWKAGQGTSATSAANPTRVGSCTASSSCLASLTYSAISTTTLASVWPDYSSADKGFVASDDGKLYRISCLFHCPLNTNPTVDWVFTLPVAGTGGKLPMPTIPVYDGSRYVFIADQLGEAWSVDVSGTTPVLAAGPLMVGGGGCTTANPPGRTGTPLPCTANGGSFGIPDGIMVDTSAGKAFAFSGNDGVSAVVVQMNFNLTGVVRDRVGLGGVGNASINVGLHLGQPDNNYWVNPTLGRLFLCGTGTGNTQPWDYWIGFTNYPTMNSTVTQAPFANIPVAGAPCTAFTEFYNPSLNLGGNPNDHDLLMSGVIDPTNGLIITDDISNGSIAGPLNFVFYPGGISDIVIDNTATPIGFPQASSMYFSTLAVVTQGSCSSARCGVKLSQLDLQ